MAVTSSPHLWQAEGYHEHSSAQHDAALQLLQHIHLKGTERVLDIGCGDGKITAGIARQLPTGSILGLDIAPEMIDFARTKFSNEHYPNLRFSLQDASVLNFQAEFDVIFSSFALQWVLDHNVFLKSAHRSLAPNGYLAATIPLGISSALEQSISEITSLAEWSSYFHNFVQKWRFTNQNEFSDLLSSNQFLASRIELVLQEVIFPSRESLEKYILQWFAYLGPLPEPLKMIFFKQVMDRYFVLEPFLKNGQARFNFPRLDIIASRSVF